MKTCFIIMPISDHENYDPGHFRRVYDYLIKPACLLADFQPIRADDIVNTNHIALDIIKKVIESDMALCDLSSKNPNVLYELGIRQAFNKPVTFIKDIVTDRIFDIQGFRDNEYHPSLRFDLVESSVKIIAESIVSTYNNHENEINSLVKLLGISAAQVRSTEVSSDTEIILNAVSGISDRVLSLERTMKSPKSNSIFISDDKIDVDYLPLYTENEEILIGDGVVDAKHGAGLVVSNDFSGVKVNFRRSKINILFSEEQAKERLHKLPKSEVKMVDL